MTNFKNTIVNATVSSLETSDSGKTFIKLNIFDKWVMNPLTKELLPSGKKQTVKLYQGGRGFDSALQALEANKSIFSIVGCLMSFQLQGDDSVITFNKLVLEEDESDLAEIFAEERSYWLEEGKLIEETQVVSQAEEVAEAKTVKAKA